MRTKDFYEFMVKRETLRLRKETPEPYPWTDDPILQEYKFTNVKREHDKTTRWFWENVLDPNHYKPKEYLLFNCALFRYFGTIEFSEAICGWNEMWATDKEHIRNTAEARLAQGKKVFTGAYVITNQGIKSIFHFDYELICASKMEGPLNFFFRGIIKDSYLIFITCNKCIIRKVFSTITYFNKKFSTSMTHP